MKRYLAVILATLLYSGYVYAQSTADPVLPGFLSTTGCSGSFKSCFIPFSSANPLPVAGSGGGAAGVNTASTITSVACSVSGNAFFTQPFTGTSLNEVVVRLAACNGTASYTYPTAFANTPGIVPTSAVAAGVVTTVSATAVTVTGTPSTGFIFLQGN